jgi:hypothetical protein
MSRQTGVADTDAEALGWLSRSAATVPNVAGHGQPRNCEQPGDLNETAQAATYPERGTTSPGQVIIKKVIAVH